MDHADHVALLRAGVLPGPGPVTWADIGSGRGAFTLALADLLGAGAVGTGTPGGGARLISIDRDGGALADQARAIAERFPQAKVDYIRADFTRPLDLPPLDGLLMANSLHFVRDKVPVLERLVGHLRPGGRFLLVEYDADRGNPWVPHPLSYRTWEQLAGRVGLGGTHLTGRVPSRILGAIYSAASERPV